MALCATRGDENQEFTDRIAIFFLLLFLCVLRDLWVAIFLFLFFSILLCFSVPRC